MTVWDFRCHARCDNRWSSSDSLNQTIWDMDGAGWYLRLESNGDVAKVLCPTHANGASALSTERWLVECFDCDFDEEFADQEEAEEVAAEHNGDCDHHGDHYSKVLSPQQVREREARRLAAHKEAALRAKERKYYERYVAFLEDQDQNTRRDMQQRHKSQTVRPYHTVHYVAMVVAIIAAIAALSFALAGCGASKHTEPYKDAHRGSNNSAPADTGTMPDGFSNFSSKCDHGNRVYTLFHHDSAYGGITVVPNAEGC